MRLLLSLALAAVGLHAQSPRIAFDSFEVATVKPTASDWNGGRFIRLESGNRFIARNHALRTLVAAAYNLTPKAVIGNDDWLDSARWDIEARTPGEARPTLDEQMKMLRKLLSERCGLTFHRAQRVMALYTLSVLKGGAKLKASELPAEDEKALIGVVFPDRVELPGRNASMGQLASMLQRAVLGRPVIDRTGLGAARFDFDLEWTPDETQYDGKGPKEWAEGTKPSLFAALREQLGLRLDSGKGPVEVLVIERVERPSAN